MKKLILPLLLVATATMAQPKIEVEEQVVAIDGTSRNSLTVMIPEATDSKAVSKAWTKYLKGWKGKVSDKKFIFADDCKVKEMGDNTFDVYSVVEEATDEGVKVVAAIDLGGAYLSTADHPEQYPVAQKLVRNFAVDYLKELMLEKIESQQDILGNFQKELSGLQKDKGKLESDIADHEKEVEKLKGEVEKNISNQELKQKEIEGQKAIIRDLQVEVKNIK